MPLLNSNHRKAREREREREKRDREKESGENELPINIFAIYSPICGFPFELTLM
jgi:hypothetical protein